MQPQTERSANNVHTDALVCSVCNYWCSVPSSDCFHQHSRWSALERRQCRRNLRVCHWATDNNQGVSVFAAHVCVPLHHAAASCDDTLTPFCTRGQLGGNPELSLPSWHNTVAEAPVTIGFQFRDMYELSPYATSEVPNQGTQCSCTCCLAHAAIVHHRLRCNRPSLATSLAPTLCSTRPPQRPPQTRSRNGRAQKSTGATHPHDHCAID